MSTEAIPKYSLLYSIESGKHGLSQARIHPLNASIPAFILKFIENLADDYITAVGEQFNEAVTGRISFSLGRGIVVEKSSDERIKKIIEGANQQSAVVTVETAKEMGCQSIKRRELEEKDRKKMVDELKGEPFIAFDASAMALFENGVKKSLQIDFEIEKRTVLGANALTTGSMRYPHLYQDLHTRFNDRRKLETTSVCIAGPGLKEEQGNAPFVPQFVELFTLFPNAQFLLLDKDKRSLKAMSDQFNKCSFASYDPAMLCWRILEKRPKFQQVFSDMKDCLAKTAMAPKNATEMLDGVGPLKRVVVKVDPKKIEVRPFDFVDSQFKEEKFDVIVATVSIFHTLHDAVVRKDPNFNPLAFLTKFLLPLKENGSLYVETMMTELLFHKMSSEQSEKLIQEIEAILGNRIRIEKVPIQNFIPEARGDHALISSTTCQEIRDDKPTYTFSTHSLTVITRTAEKAREQTS